MIRAVVSFAAIALVAACSTAQVTKANAITAEAVQAGALFCQQATTVGPVVVALANAAGLPVSVTGQASADVALACAIIGAVPVSPPVNPATVSVVIAPTTLPPVVVGSAKP